MLFTLINIGILLIAVLHLWFLILEMFLWQKTLGLKTFNIDPEYAKRSASLAANQGLYNGFLSAGLFWSVYSKDLTQAYNLKIFFLTCVLIAGIYAGITVSRKILIIQAIPPMIILCLLLYI